MDIEIAPPHFSLNNYVGEVGVISMDEERMKTTRQEFEKIHTTFKLFNGVRATPTQIQEVSGGCTFLCPASSPVGIFLAHRQLWEYMLQTGLSSIAIFEDDVRFTKDIADVLPSAFKELPPDWDMVYLGCQTCYSRSLLDLPVCYRKSTPFSPHLNRPSCLFGGESYIVSRKGAQKLLEKIKHLHLHFDFWLTLNRDAFDIYALSPPVAFQDPLAYKTSQNMVRVPLLLNKLLDFQYHPNDPYDGRTLSWLLSLKKFESPFMHLVITGWWFIFLIVAFAFKRLFFLLILYLWAEMAYLAGANRLTPNVLQIYLSLMVAVFVGRIARYNIDKAMR
jgi:GR25 family glycosyltransferase involved in LPS biosynthesis